MTEIAVFSTSRADVGALSPVFTALYARRVGNVYWFETPMKLEGDWLAVLCGDRFETLEIAYRLNLNHIPIAHLSGGDLTEGSQDDCFRHAITKLSHLHFPTNDDAARRIIQMGEEPWRVHMCGSPSLDEINSADLPDRKSALAHVGLSDGPFILVALHPSTLGSTEAELANVREYLGSLSPTIGKVLIGPNADAGHELIEQEFIRLAQTFSRAVFISHIHRRFYLALMKHCKEMVGNSSAMLYEAPTLGTETVIIGDRQKGRKPIFGDGKAAERIAEVICGIDRPQSILRKKFHEIQWQAPQEKKVA